MKKTRWVKPVLIGVIMAAIFVVLDASVPEYIVYENPAYLEYETLVFAFSLFVVCSALTDTLYEGMVCGFASLVAQSLGTFARYAATDGVTVALALVLYPLLLTTGYLAAGAAGGYVGKKLGATGRQRGRRKSKSYSALP